MYKLAVLQALIAMLLIGLVPILIKWIDADIVVIGLIRLAIGYLFITTVTFLFTRQGPLPIGSSRIRQPLAVIGLLFGMHWVTFFLSIKLATPSIAAIGLATYGIHLMIYGRLFLQEPISLVGIISIALAIIGNFLVMPVVSLQNEATLGLLIGIVSGAFYAMLPIYFKRRPEVTAAEKTQGQFFYASFPFLLLLPWSSWEISVQDWWVMIFMGVVCTGVGHACWIRASTVLPTPVTSALFYISVPFTMVFSTLLLDEHHEWQTLSGAALIILANFMALFLRRKTW